VGERVRLRIGIAGPVSLDLLDYPEGPPPDLPEGHPAPIVSHFVNALLERGHRLVVFTTSRGLVEPMVLDQGRLVVCVAPRYRPRSALLFFSRERRSLRSLMRRYPCDLIHAMWSYEYALAALQAGGPVVVHYKDHAWTILKHSRDAYRFLRWLLSAYVTLRAKNRIANSAYLKQAFGPRGRDMEVISNFLPSEVVWSQPTRSRKRTGVVVTVSNGFHGHKNVATALGAFASLRHAGLVCEYRLVGNEMGPGQEAQSFAVRNGLAESVVFLGKLPFDQTLAEIGDAALLLHPSLEESFGMTILEAMAVGTPVIAGRRSGNVPDLLDSGRCGYLCDVRDPADIERAATDALTRREETETRVTLARRRFEDFYSEEKVMEDLERYYSRMLHLPDTLRMKGQA